jgi:hypothetical protein
MRIHWNEFICNFFEAIGNEIQITNIKALHAIANAGVLKVAMRLDNLALLDKIQKTMTKKEDGNWYLSMKGKEHQILLPNLKRREECEYLLHPHELNGLPSEKTLSSTIVDGTTLLKS